MIFPISETEARSIKRWTRRRKDQGSASVEMVLLTPLLVLLTLFVVYLGRAGGGTEQVRHAADVAARRRVNSWRHKNVGGCDGCGATRPCQQWPQLFVDVCWRDPRQQPRFGFGDRHRQLRYQPVGFVDARSRRTHCDSLIDRSDRSVSGRMSLSRKHDQSGSISGFVVVVFTAVLGFAGLVIDGARNRGRQGERS